MSKADGERLRDELARQHRILRGEVAPRLLLVGLAYAICAQFVAAWIMVALFLVEVVGEVVSQRLLRGLDPVRSPVRYRFSF
jgi:two-component system, sensor histidine kinase